MGVRVVKPGVWTTVQDLGRPGHRDRGVPVGGAFDRASLKLANALLGNPLDAAALEFTLVGGIYEATVALGLAIAGAPFAATVERPDGSSRPLRVPQSFALDAGDRLVVEGTSIGARAYLAVQGGWTTAPVMGSRSSEQPLRTGEIVPAEPGDCRSRWIIAEPFGTAGASVALRVLDGPDAGPTAWDGREYVVGAQSNRIGLRLEGPAWPLDSEPPPDRLSAPVVPGAVQIAGGQPIVLGVACGTMGGYPDVAQVASADLDRLGQLRPGDRVVLRRVDRDEARRADQARREALRSLFVRVGASASG